MTKQIVLCLVVLGMFACVFGKNLYEGNKFHVTPLSKMNWDKIIVKQRNRMVSIVHFYKDGDDGSLEFSRKFREDSNVKDGIFKYGGVDCNEHYDLCEKESVSKFPTVRIYPPLPMPPFDHEGELDIEKVSAAAGRHVPSNVQKINKDNIEKFLSESPAVPKVFLFTDKKGIPMIYRALSKSFEKKLFFGIVQGDEGDSIMNRYGVSKTPTILVVKTGEKKPHVYKGGINYQEIFTFLNVYSETFVAGGGSSQDTKAHKSWLTEIAPELTWESGKDICFGAENALCVILLLDGAATKEDTDLLKQLHKKFDRKIERGTKYNFMWLNTQLDSEFAQIFDITARPSIVVLNPGRRKRYAIHSGGLNVDDLKTTFDKISGGDMKFTNLKGELPHLKVRSK